MIPTVLEMTTGLNGAHAKTTIANCLREVLCILSRSAFQLDESVDQESRGWGPLPRFIAVN